MGFLRLTQEDAHSLPGVDFSQGQWMSPRPPKIMIITIQTTTALSSLYCVRRYTPVTFSHFTTELSGECYRTPVTDETPPRLKRLRSSTPVTQGGRRSPALTASNPTAAAQWPGRRGGVRALG